jgi:hypothetical protein
VTANPRVLIGVLAAALVVLGIVIAVRGFDDSLTRRGFVIEGDKICTDTVVRTIVELDRARTSGRIVGQVQAIRMHSDAYSRAAARLEGLDLEDQDEAMRDRMVEDFERIASGLMTAAETSTGIAEAQTKAITAIAPLQPLGNELRDYGFAVCGGRAPS